MTENKSENASVHKSRATRLLVCVCGSETKMRSFKMNSRPSNTAKASFWCSYCGRTFYSYEAKGYWDARYDVWLHFLGGLRYLDRYCR